MFDVINLKNNSCYIITKVEVPGYFYSDEPVLIRYKTDDISQNKKDIADFGKKIQKQAEQIVRSQYIVEGYDRDTDTCYVTDGCETADEAFALKEKAEEYENSRADTNREHRRTKYGNVPDLDCFRVVMQEGCKVTYLRLKDS